MTVNENLSIDFEADRSHVRLYPHVFTTGGTFLIRARRITLIFHHEDIP